MIIFHIFQPPFSFELRYFDNKISLFEWVGICCTPASSDMRWHCQYQAISTGLILEQCHLISPIHGRTIHGITCRVQPGSITWPWAYLKLISGWGRNLFYKPVFILLFKTASSCLQITSQQTQQRCFTALPKLILQQSSSSLLVLEVHCPSTLSGFLAPRAPIRGALCKSNQTTANRLRANNSSQYP